jgi:hypothetical protein
MSVCLRYIRCALPILALCAGARADEQALPANPRAEMRAAAEAQADIDPDSAVKLHSRMLAPAKPNPGRDIKQESALHVALREAVRAEVAREAAPPEPRSAIRSNSRKSGNGNRAGIGNGGDNESDTSRGSSAAAQAHSAATQAQQARRNSDVVKMNGHARAGKP